MSKIMCIETLGTCPKCRALVDLEVHLTSDKIEYYGVCPEHGAFVRLANRLDLSEAGEKVSSTVAFRGQVASV